jgi:cytochrome-b5 reductase
MLQVIEEVLGNPEDKTEISLVFGNLTPKDILLKDRLDELAKKHSNFTVLYVVDKAPFGGITFRGATGYITQKILSKQCPGPSEDCMILVRDTFIGVVHFISSFLYGIMGLTDNMQYRCKESV